MSWFEDWFDSPLYELLYAYRNEEEANKLAAFIEKQIPKEHYPCLVDVGCGRGRHSISLAERGYRVTGFDLSPMAIDKAKTIAKDRGQQQIEFIVNDMRTPLPDTFDAAVNLFTTFGYFLDEDQNVQVLKSIRSMLRLNGLLLIDFLNAEKVERNLVPNESGSNNGIRYSINRHIEDGFVYKKIEFDGPPLDKPRVYTERVKLFDENWFRKSLKESGFKPVDIWGNYSGDLFDAIHSPRLIILSKAT